jgi:hypothetical protein
MRRPDMAKSSSYKKRVNDAAMKLRGKIMDPKIDPPVLIETLLALLDAVVVLIEDVEDLERGIRKQSP